MAMPLEEWITEGADDARRAGAGATGAGWGGRRGAVYGADATGVDSAHGGAGSGTSTPPDAAGGVGREEVAVAA